MRSVRILEGEDPGINITRAGDGLYTIEPCRLCSVNSYYFTIFLKQIPTCLRFIHSFVYYGLTLNSANFGTNIYVTFCFFGLSEIPACILSLVLMKFIGRRYAVVTCMIPAGLACIFTTFLPPGGWMTTVAVLGKLWISSSFGSIYLFTVELFSTNLRYVNISQRGIPIVLAERSVISALTCVICTAYNRSLNQTRR
ncbi:putative organic cation transporter protein-like [Apostichopus japonicus]|uniref:Putative organic cation transporter protein-like n=1 Tax=Stichopus japonicus TaxID=307972 RepID=A0A2G8KJY4_STIJA|nr:putative organic cation transporter protein-like [Apostichopus japonicus]